MGEKEERTWGRLELAEYLNHLSEQLRRGALEAQGRHWTVPEDLHARAGVQGKEGAPGRQAELVLVHPGGL
jgi:hypothetical protein